MSRMARTRPAIEVVLSTLGLVIWAAHFAAIYAVNAVACERALAGTRLVGLPFVPAVVGGLTVLAVGALVLVMRSGLRGLAPPLDEGGEGEPRFTRWFGVATAALAALAVVFQAVPALVVPPCG
jgi:hypothetical protein